MEAIQEDYMIDGKIGQRILAGRGNLGRVIEIIAPKKKRPASSLPFECLLDQLKRHNVVVVEEENQTDALAQGKKSHLFIANKCNAHFLKHVLPGLQSNLENTIFLIGSESDASSYCAQSIIFVDGTGRVVKELPYGLDF